MENRMDIDKNRKRFFFSLCISIIIMAFMVLTVINYVEKDFFEIKINLVVISVMLFSFLALKFFNVDMLIYRLTHFMTCLMFYFTVYSGSGKEAVLYWILVMPLLFFFFFEKKEGTIWASVFIILLFILMMVSHKLGGHYYCNLIISRFFITLLIITILDYGLESSRYSSSILLKKNNLELLEEKQRLEKAIGEIKTLSGLIPICSQCKKIRNDDGYWEQVETYIRNHSEADFSHSICPDCIDKLYPDLKKKNNK